MPFILCPKHGGHGAAAVCEHIAGSMRAGLNLPPVLTPIKAVYLKQQIGPTWLCPQCATRHNIPPTGAAFESEEGLERYWTDIGFTPVCAHCLELARQDAH